MAIRRIHELPIELPHARIYLDDLDEIRKILVEARTTAVEAFRKKWKSDRRTEITVVYHVTELLQRGAGVGAPGT